MPDSKVSALSPVTPLDGSEQVPVVQAGTSRRAKLEELGFFHSQLLAADQSNSTVTPTKVTGLDHALPVGTYQFTYMVRYQAAALTTGVRFDVNFSGTASTFLWQQRWVDTGNTASTTTAAPDQDAVATTGHVVAAFASRAKGTAGRGTTLSVDTVNADMLMVIEGLVIVTVAGNMELWHGSEVAAASTVKAGSSLVAIKAV